jgi:hypothetical protein
MYNQIDSIGPQNPLLCMDISSTGECMVFGDASAMVHQWTDREEFHVCMHARTSSVYRC